MRLALAGTLAILLGAPAGAQTLPPHPPDDVYTYTITVDGKTTGHSTIDIKSDPRAVTVTEESRIDNQTFATRTVYDAFTLSEASYSLSSPGGSVSAQIAGTAVSVHAANAVVPLTAPGAPFVLMLDGLISPYVFIPAAANAHHASAFAFATTIDPQVIPISIELPLHLTRPTAVLARAIPLRFAIGKRVSTLWYDPFNDVVELIDTPSQHAQYQLISVRKGG